jgi:CheY-like chemotaxis protein
MMLTAPEILQARILIVDDQPANVQLLRQMLVNNGFVNITSTTDPRQVALLHRHHPFDLILLDLQMPGMSGFEVMEGLKANQAESYLPVIVLTAQPDHKLRALQAGAKDFVSKPFDLLEVSSRIRNLLEVRLLYNKLEDRSTALEQTLRMRTAELRESEALAPERAGRSADWYWEQNESGDRTHVSGSVDGLLGGGVTSFLVPGVADTDLGWDEAERASLQLKMAARQPFKDFAFNRIKADGSRQCFWLSGEPMFDSSHQFIGYRGMGSVLPD